MPATIVALACDPLAVDVLANLVERPMVDGTHMVKEESQRKVVAGVLTYEGRIYISKK